MIKFEYTEIVGWQHALRGMRNAKESWDRSDNVFFHDGDYYDIRDNFVSCSGFELGKNFEIGANDFELMKQLCKAGSDHRKFMRMLVVYVDITAPLYLLKEMDQYKIGTVSNSCSTMHCIHTKAFTLDNFSVEHLEDEALKAFEEVIRMMNIYRAMFNTTKDKKYWHQLIQLLPSSYNQRRTYMLNYEVLANIYKSRKNHKLDEWHDFCDWIKTLPYSELITGESDGAE